MCLISLHRMHQNLKTRVKLHQTIELWRTSQLKIAKFRPPWNETRKNGKHRVNHGLTLLKKTPLKPAPRSLKTTCHQSLLHQDLFKGKYLALTKRFQMMNRRFHSQFGETTLRTVLQIPEIKDPIVYCSLCRDNFHPEEGCTASIIKKANKKALSTGDSKKTGKGKITYRKFKSDLDLVVVRGRNMESVQYILESKERELAYAMYLLFTYGDYARAENRDFLMSGNQAVMDHWKRLSRTMDLLLRIACTKSTIRYKVCISFSVCGPSLAESEVSMFSSVLSRWTGTFFLPIQWRPTSFDLLCLENFCFSSCC